MAPGSCPAPASAPVQQLGGTTMGTTWSVKFVGSEAAAQTMRRAIPAVLDRIIAQMSPWESDSDLSRFNPRPCGEWQALPAEFRSVMEHAIRIAARRTVPTTPPWARWSIFGALDREARSASPPSSSETARALEQLRLATARLRRQQTPTSAAHSSAIGSQRYRQGLRRRPGHVGVARAWHPSCAGRHWRRTFRPRRQAGRHTVVGVDRSTHQPRRRRPQRRFSSRCMISPSPHPDANDISSIVAGSTPTLIDPRTGSPIANGMVTATVLHPSCMQADAYATALMVMGPDAGMTFATQKGTCRRHRLQQDRWWPPSRGTAVAGAARYARLGVVSAGLSSDHPLSQQIVIQRGQRHDGRMLGMIRVEPNDRHIEIEHHRRRRDASAIMLSVQKNDATREPRVTLVT